MGVGRGFHWAGGALGVLEVAELRPLWLCGGGGRKEREGSERPHGLPRRNPFSNQQQEGEVTLLTKNKDPGEKKTRQRGPVASWTTGASSWWGSFVQ